MNGYKKLVNLVNEFELAVARVDGEDAESVNKYVVAKGLVLDKIETLEKEAAQLQKMHNPQASLDSDFQKRLAEAMAEVRFNTLSELNWWAVWLGVELKDTELRQVADRIATGIKTVARATDNRKVSGGKIDRKRRIKAFKFALKKANKTPGQVHSGFGNQYIQQNTTMYQETIDMVEDEMIAVMDEIVRKQAKALRSFRSKHGMEF